MTEGSGVTDTTQTTTGSTGPQSPQLRDAIVLVIGIVLLNQVIPRLFFALDPPELEANVFELVVRIALIAWAIGFVVWVSRKRKLPIRTPNVECGKRVVDIAIGVGVAVVVLVIDWIIYYVFETEFSVTRGPFDYEIATGQITFGLIIGCMFATTIGPVAEEMSFRWLIYRAMRSRLGVPIAILLQAVVFAAVHTYSMLLLIGVFIGGLAMGIVYEWRKSLLAPIVLHVTYNVVVMVWVMILVLTVPEAPVTPWMGAALEKAEDGVRVAFVVPSGPADRAGIYQGDVITSIDDTGTVLPAHVIEAVLMREVGDTIRVRFIRDGSLKSLDIVLESRRRPG